MRRPKGTRKSREDATTGSDVKVCVPAASRIQQTTRTVATIRKNNSEEVRVRIVDLNGFAMVDTRVFSTPRRAQDEPRPTKGGFCVSRAELPHLIEALQIAEREASK